MSSSASAPTSHASSSPPAEAVAGFEPQTVEIYDKIFFLAHGDAGRGRGGLGAARGQHRHDHRVDLPQGVQQPGFGGAQRRAEHRHGLPAGVLDRVRERVRERGVPGHVVRAVVQHRDLGAFGAAGFALQQAPLRRLRGRFEAVPGEQDRVGQEAVQFGEVARAAVGEVAVRLGAHAAGHRGALHQLGVRCLLAAQHDDGSRSGEQRVQPFLPGATAAEEPDDHEIDALQQGRQVVHAQPRRVAEPVVRAAGARAEQIGVRCGQEQDHAARSPGFGDAGVRAGRMVNLPRGRPPRSRRAAAAAECPGSRISARSGLPTRLGSDLSSALSWADVVVESAPR